MAGSYRQAVEALMPILEGPIASGVADLAGGEAPQVLGLPDPTLDRRSVWITPVQASVDRGIDWTFDESTAPIYVCVSVPYELQADEPLIAWDLCDLLIATFPDWMTQTEHLRGTRRKSVYPTIEQWDGPDSSVQIVVRCRLDVPVRTRAQT